MNTVAISIFTNRALCYSKKKLDANVIADTTYVIDNLTKKNVKAYYRRALAYKNYGQYKEALADLNQIIAFEPKNKDATKEITIVKKLFEDDLAKQYQKQNKQSAPKTEAAKPKISEASQPSRPKIQEIKELTPSQAAPKRQSPKKRVKIGSETIEKAAKIAAEHIGKDKIRLPNTSYGFEADINSLRKNEEDLYNYVSHIPPSTYSKIYKNMDIQADYLVAILTVLDKFEKDNDRILNILYHFSLTQNITMTMMFFNDSDRELIEGLLKKAEGATDPNKDKMLQKARSMLE